MKRTILHTLLIGSTMSFAAAGTAIAQGQGGSQGATPPENGQVVNPMVRPAGDFKNYDVNQDRVVELKELQDQGIDNPEQFMQGLDTNQDAQVSEEEWNAGQQGGGTSGGGNTSGSGGGQ